MTDLTLAIAHHFCVFALSGLLIAEIALLRPGIAGERLRQLGAVDLAYGAVAGLVIVVGVLRVIFGAAGADYYIHNWMFWVKMAAFVFVGLISVPPTLAILGWGRALRANPDFAPDAATVARFRVYFTVEIAGFAIILGAAAAMARGYGMA